MSYRVLVLGSNAKNMPLTVLRKINELVKVGATITGVKPESTPSLSDDVTEFKNLVNQVWATDNARVYMNEPLCEVLKKLNIVPDFTYTKPQTDTKLATEEKELAAIDGSWNVSFQKDRGAPSSATFDNLVSYTENADAVIKYFSGTASYTKTFLRIKVGFQKHNNYGSILVM